MKEIVRLEIKRVLDTRILIIILVAIAVFSVFNSLSSLKKYDVYDAQGKLIISARDNINESKKPEHTTFLDENTIKNVVMGNNKSKYLYNSNLTALIASNYNKKLVDLTDEDIANFYVQRSLNVMQNFGGSSYGAGAADASDLDKISLEVKKMATPLKIGYSEGFKTLNNDLIDFITVIIYFIPFLILFIFGESPKVNMNQLCASAKYGQKRLIWAKIVAAFLLGITIYIASVAIYSISKLAILGFEGGNLPIQGSILYLFCPYDLTFFQQYLINISLGFMALLLLICITLLITVLVKQLMSSAVILTVFLGIMPMLPNNNFFLNFYLKNFLPFGMVNFNNYYIKPHIYNIFGNILPTYAVSTMITILICTICIFLTWYLKSHLLTRRNV